MYTLTVTTPSHQYPIFIETDLIQHPAKTFASFVGKKVVIISNDTIAPLYLSRWQKFFKQFNCEVSNIILPDGEKYKNGQTLNLIYDGLMQNRADRQTTLIALGGGVIGDMAGFAAATYQRGVPFIQIPTTLLSQVDSSVGGKTAINHPLGKNMIGAFYQPQAVLIDLNTLSTLPQREFSAGMAEVIKYALLGDIKYLSWLEKNIEHLMVLEQATLAYAVHHCCKMKADIVSMDEKENGIRALLNLGHTFAHAIEAEMGYGNWLHGEAVAVGMVLACHLSEIIGYLTPDDTERVVNLLKKAKLPTTPPMMTFDAWLNHMSHDKKIHDGKLRFVILEKLGQAKLIDNISSDVLKETLAPFLFINDKK